MSYIEILILRRLRSGPAHGYELRKRVEQTTGVVLHNNSLYPALKRFEEAGAVTKAAQPQAGRPPRLVYTLTEVGHELLHDMLAGFPRSRRLTRRSSWPVSASSLFLIPPNGPPCSPPALVPCASRWRTSPRCGIWPPCTASPGGRWSPPS